MPQRAYLARTIVALAVLVVLPVARAAGQTDEPGFRSHLDRMTRVPTRVIGTDGYRDAGEYLVSQFEALGDRIEYRRHDYKQLMPVTDSASLTAEDGTAYPVFPVWPSGVRLNATPTDGINAEVVYVARARFHDLKPGSLLGQIAAVDAREGNWQQAAYFGARAILILGDDTVNNSDLRSHDLAIPVHMPRFYVPPGPLADSIRGGTLNGKATLRASLNWRSVTATNFYVYVKPSVAVPPDWSQTNPPAALMITAPYESMSLVPDLAPGAGQAVQAAAALTLLRSFADNPPMRPVVFFFAGGDSMNLRATRQMLMALADPPTVWNERLKDLAELQSHAATDLQVLQSVAASPQDLRATIDREAILRIRKLIETDTTLEQEELFRYRLIDPKLWTSEVTARAKHLEERQISLAALRYAFEKEAHRLTEPDYAEPAKSYVRRAIESLNGTDQEPGLIQQYAARQAELEQRVALYQWLANLLGRNPDPSDDANNSRLIELLVGLDLSDKGVRVGPMFWGAGNRTASISQIQDFADWIFRQQRMLREGTGGEWFKSVAGVFDPEPLANARAPQSWMPGSLALSTEVAQGWGVPAFSLVTLDDLRLRRDTPADTRAAITEESIEKRILPQLNAVKIFLSTAWNDVRFRGPIELKWDHSHIAGQVVSPAPGRPVPDLPRPGFKVTYQYVSGEAKIPALRWMPYAMGMRRIDITDCDAEGRYEFEALSRVGQGDDMVFLGTQAYKPEPDTGRILAASDFGRSSTDIKWFANLRQEIKPLRNLVFNGEEFSLFGLYDPRFLQGLGEVTPLDARRNAEPQKYNLMVHNQMMAGMVEPTTRLLLLFRYGRVGNRLLMLNVDREAAEGDLAEGARGFTVQELNDIGPLSLTTSRDFMALNDIRLSDYRKAGVSSGLVDELHATSQEQIKAADAANTADDGAALVRNANGAWADQARVYQATQVMATDVIRAAIFLLLLLVPFSFCMERLMIGSPSIYKQIAGTLGIFSVMTGALWSFHPAFRISSSPLIIILAFAIIFMSLVVMFVVYSKFDSELKKIRSGRGSVEGASFARASVVTSAVLLGIANMRRRKFRTALTATTIVLITFAVLAFTSATRYVGTTTLPTGIDTSHPGLMLRQRGFRPMPGPVLENLEAVLGKDRQVVERYWNVNAWDPNDQIHIVAGGDDGTEPRVFAAQGLLGLSPGESKLSKIGEVIGLEKLSKLESGREDVIYLASAIAGQLKVQEGDKVRLGGIDLEVAGIFSADDFDQKVQMLSGEPLAPLKYTSGALDAGGRKLTDTGVDDLNLDANSTASELAAGAYEHLSASRFAIVSNAVSKLLPNSSLRSLGLAAQDYEQVSADADELSRRFAIAMFAGYEDGVKMVAASNLASVSGAGQVAVPLAIAGLIVFNTMMGSIAERKREIHVYTSLGLAPVHVGALFLAEAMTYGLIGAVFGYVIGQGVGTLLLHLGWLGGVTLNYSGTSAMMTMGLILLIVLLSALVPARLASKLAAPSIERSWRVPMPKGGEIIANLPFTINKTAADGALAYLAEFFEAHQEGSIGKFSAGKVEGFTFSDESTGIPSRGLKTVIWLTPFDLGVRQQLMLLIHPGQYPDIYEVQVVLQRLSGDDGSWYRMNRTFLTELRKQFLQWRSLAPSRMQLYVDQSSRLFDADAPLERMVTTVPGEEVRMG